MWTQPWSSALGAAGQALRVIGPCQAPRGHQLSTASTRPDSGSSEPQGWAGLPRAGGTEFLSPACPGCLIPGEPPLQGSWLVVPGPGWGLESVVIVPRVEKENNPVYGKGGKGESAAAGQWPSWGDRGPLLGKQEARISRTRRATRRPPAPASAESQQLVPAPSCLSVRPFVRMSL